MKNEMIRMKNSGVHAGYKRVIAGSICCLTGLSVSAASYTPAELRFVDLSDGAVVGAQPVQVKAFTPSKERSDSVVTVFPEEIVQSELAGLGGAFNEQGGEAFMSLPKDKQKAVAEALFNPKTGAGLTFCRTAVGSSDFGLGAYSYSETPDDYEMKHFSVERDTKSVIPFVRAAQAENPQFRLFASPWSPPGWMKESGKMDGGRLPGKVDNPLNVLKADPKIYQAYALYFSNYVQAYAKHGVTVERIVVQNETDMSPTYPGCNMLPEQMSELILNYIRPQFEKDGLKAEIWAGTFRSMRGDAEKFIKLDGARAVDGVGLQYCTSKTLKALRTSDSKLKMMHTEGKCWNGKNGMDQARSRFGEIAMWLNEGCENYCYWNLVLNETSKSAWGWKQNSLVVIDRQSKEVAYTSDFAPIALLSQCIRPGDQLLKVETSDKTSAIAVRNNERLVVLIQNDAEMPVIRTLQIEGQAVSVEIPAQQLCAVVFN
jgi:glucosylceramidase